MAARRRHAAVVVAGVAAAGEWVVVTAWAGNRLGRCRRRRWRWRRWGRTRSCCGGRGSRHGTAPSSSTWTVAPLVRELRSRLSASPTPAQSPSPPQKNIKDAVTQRCWNAEDSGLSEVFVDPARDESLIFDLLDLKGEVEDGNSALWFLRDIANEQDAGDNLVVEHSGMIELSGLRFGDAPAVAGTAVGQLAISKGRQGREAQNNVRECISIPSLVCTTGNLGSSN